MVRGLFVVLEGVDGSGKSTQIPLLTKHIKRLSKYNDVLETHEPWESQEIKKKLEEDSDAFSDGLSLAKSYIEDREKHSKKIIEPNVMNGVFVICDRHKMSTCAYQWAQGVNLRRLEKMHEGKGILIPDLTFYIHVDSKTAEKRLNNRAEKKEKFEKSNFRQEAIKKFLEIYEISQKDKKRFGKVIMVDGKKSIAKISEQINKEFGKLYAYRRI